MNNPRSQALLDAVLIELVRLSKSRDVVHRVTVHGQRARTLCDVYSYTVQSDTTKKAQVTCPVCRLVMETSEARDTYDNDLLWVGQRVRSEADPVIVSEPEINDEDDENEDGEPDPEMAKVMQKEFG